MALILYSTTEAAEELQLSRQRVHQLINEDKIPYETLGSHRFITNGVLSWFKRQLKKEAAYDL